MIADIIAAFHGRTLAGAIAIGITGAPCCVRIVSRLTGNKFVSIASPPVSFASLAGDSRGRFERLRVTLQLIGSNIALQVRARTRGIQHAMDIQRKGVSAAKVVVTLP